MAASTSAEMSADAGRPPDLGFDSRGMRCAGELDIENRTIGTTSADMTAEDWAEAAEMVRRWDAGWRP